MLILDESPPTSSFSERLDILCVGVNGADFPDLLSTHLHEVVRDLTDETYGTQTREEVLRAKESLSGAVNVGNSITPQMRQTFLKLNICDLVLTLSSAIPKDELLNYIEVIGNVVKTSMDELNAEISARSSTNGGHLNTLKVQYMQLQRQSAHSGPYTPASVAEQIELYTNGIVRNAWYIRQSL